MDFSSNENLPRLLPLWHDLAAMDIVQSKKINPYKIPDYGGMGIDISFAADELKSDVRKHTVDQVHFGPHVCALPYLPPNKIPLIEDPCISPLNSLKSDFQKFSMSLSTARSFLTSSTEKATKERRQKEFCNLYASVKQMCLNESSEKIPVSYKILEMANKFPQSDQIDSINFDFAGGCLISTRLENKSYLLHPIGKKLEKLALTLLEETSDPNKVFNSETESHTIKLKSGCIQQIKSAFDGYCYVLQKKRCYVVKLTDLLNVSHSECFPKQKVTNIVASPYNPLELVSIDESGIMSLMDVETKQKIWETGKFAVDEEYCIDGPLSSEFGSHPRSVLYLTRKMVFAHDLRLSSNVKTLLLSNTHSTMFKSETFSCVKRLTVNPFQHLVSSSGHICLCDERYPRKPVLIWNHMLNGSPLYCDFATYINDSNSSDALLLFGTQDTNELVSFAIRSQHSHMRTVSLSSPLLLSSPSDCVDSLKLHCMDLDEAVEKRLSYSLAGACIVPYKSKPGFTAFQINSLGDIFYQDFEHTSDCDVEQTYKVTTGCVLSPPEKITPVLDNWTANLNPSTEETTGSVFKELYVDLKEFVDVAREISSQCHVCKAGIDDGDTTVSGSDTCACCGLYELQSKKLQEGYNDLSLLIGPIEEDLELQEFDTSELHSFTDPYSKKILDTWISLGDETRTPPWTNNSDFELSNISTETSKSYSNLPSTDRHLDLSLQDIFDPSLEVNFHSYGVEQFQDMSLFSQESTENIILPSQEVRPVIGETLKTPSKKIKLDYFKMRKSNAGF